jgi:uncharacterized protein YndB with AHSA1/START domain
MAFFGRYVEVIPGSLLSWTNEEGDEEGSLTTVTFEESGDQTVVVIHELYPSKKALDDTMAAGSISWSGEQFEQLDQLLAA